MIVKKFPRAHLRKYDALTDEQLLAAYANGDGCRLCLRDALRERGIDPATASENPRSSMSDRSGHVAIGNVTPCEESA